MKHPAHLAIAALAATLLATLTAGLALAHVVKHVGPYEVAIGWLREPVYVGQLNAVQVVIKDAKGEPIADLGADALTVVVSAAGATSDPMALVPTFDEDTGLGTPGDYEEPIMPTAPGDYTFHVSGAIHGQKVDETISSGSDTFDAAIEASQVQFPVPVPDLGQVATRVTQTDARVTQATADARAAEDAAATATLVGVAVGVVGIILGGGALYVSLRARRREA